MSQTLTLQRTTADPVIEFEVSGGKSANTTTKLYLEIGPDGNTAIPPPDPALPGSVKFRLNKTGGGTKDFPPAGLTDTTTFAPDIAVLTRGAENPTDPRGLYVLAIAHVNGTTTAEGWRLEIQGLPGPARIVMSIEQGTFLTLSPTGICGSGGTTCPSGTSCQPPCPACPSACPPGKTCKPIFKIPVDELIFIREIPFPIPPKPCLSCPEPWMKPPPEGFERVMLSATPTLPEQKIFGANRAPDVTFTISDGEAIGPVVDAGEGQYVQLVQYRKGASPRASATAEGQTSKEIELAPTQGVSSTYRTLTWVFGILAVALALGFVMSRRGAPAGA